MIDLPMPPAWTARASFTEIDPSFWWPELRDGTSRNAIRICNRCEVRQECLNFAIDNEQHEGIWGGMTAHARKQMKRSAA